MSELRRIVLSRVFFYVVFFLTILKDVSAEVYSNIGVVNILIIIAALYVLTSGFKADKTSKLVIYAILFGVLLNVVFVGSGVGSLIAMTVFGYVYLLTPNMQLNPDDSKVFTIGSLLFILIYYFLDHSDYNPNSIALTFFMFGSFLTLFLDIKKISHIFIISVIGLFLFHIIMEYDCRTDMAAFVIYIILRLLPNKLYQNKTRLLIILLVLTIGNLMYVYIYMSMYDGLIEFESFDQFSRTFSDKTFFSGRQLIWGDLLDGLHANPLLGTGSNIKIYFFYGGMLNVHNSMLTFYALYGYPVGILSTILIIRTVLPMHQYMHIPIVKNSFACYASFLLIGFNETIIQADPFRCLIPLMLAYSTINSVAKRRQNDNRLLQITS